MMRKRAKRKLSPKRDKIERERTFEVFLSPSRHDSLVKDYGSLKAAFNTIYLPKKINIKAGLL